MLLRIGTISQGKIKCDKCGRTVVYAERYLIVKEKNGVEDEENGVVRRYCVKCSTEKGYVQTRQEKGNVSSPFSRKLKRDWSRWSLL